MNNFLNVNNSSHSLCRKLVIYLLFAFYICQMLLTLALVGSFYGVFSVFIRSLFPMDACLSVQSVAAVLENTYLIVLFIILLVSTTRKVE